MKKKGFTLIELLAVIVILAIIMVIAVPKIIDVIENARMSAFKDSAGLMAKSAQLKFAETNVLGSSKDGIVYTFESGEYTSSNTLDFKGDKPDNGIIKINNKGRVALAVVSKDGKYCATKKYTNKNVNVKSSGDGVCKVDDEIKAIVPEENLNTYTVTFNDDGDKTKVKVKAQKQVEAIKSKGKEDYVFKYWSLKKDGEEFDFNTPIAKDITLYAVYELNTVVVTFNDQGSLTTKTLMSGNTISAIDAKGKTNYIFKYWSLNENGTEYNFNTPITKDITLYAVYEQVICIRATELHTETCTGTNSGCINEGYSNGQIITYGKIGISGKLTSGDAFDCDINGDGIYNSDERFYYVTDLNTNSNYAVLIYYKNRTNTSGYPYDRSYECGDSVYMCAQNWHGPTMLISNLPTTSQWKNVSLSTTTRAIKTETGSDSTVGGKLPTAFSYSGYVARFLTAQEVNAACGITVGQKKEGELDNCKFLLENTVYTKNYGDDMYVQGYFLETPVSSRTDAVWIISPTGRNVTTHHSFESSSTGSPRPVIEVPKSKISY